MTPARAPGGCVATHYELKEELGRGAMGVVHRAYDPNLKRDVAIKVLKERPGPTSLARFLQEGQVAARVRHPNVLSVHDLVVPEGGSPYLVTDYAPGGSLRDLIKRRGLLDPHELREVLGGILSGVAALHAVGVVHRDLKPENILFDAEGVPLVADLGLARALDRETRYTQSGVLTGTPSYMAPEQLDGSTLGPPTDVYAMGVILYELLTGRLPFRANTLIEQIRMLLEVKPPSPSSFVATVDPGLTAICLRCLEKDPGARYPDAKALGSALQSWAPGRGPGRTRVGLWLAVLLASLGLIGGVTFALTPEPEAPRVSPSQRGASSTPKARVVTRDAPDEFALVLDSASFRSGSVPVLVNRAWALGLETEGLRLRSNREAGPELYLPFSLNGGKLRVQAQFQINYLTRGTAYYLRVVPGGPSAQRERIFVSKKGDHDDMAFFELALEGERVKWRQSAKRARASVIPIEAPPVGPYQVELEIEFDEGRVRLRLNRGPIQELPFELQGERFCLELTPTRADRAFSMPRTRRTTLVLPSYGDILLRELALSSEGRDRLRWRKPERDWEALGKAGRDYLRGSGAEAILEEISSLRRSASGPLRNEVAFFRAVLASRDGDEEGAKIAFQSLLSVNSLRPGASLRRLKLMQDFVAGLSPSARLAMAEAYGSEYRVNPDPAHLFKSARLFHAIDEQGLTRQAGHVISPPEALLLFLLARDAGVEVGPTLLGTAWLFHGEPDLALELLDGPAETGDSVALFWGGAAAYFTRDLAKAHRYWNKLSSEHPLHAMRGTKPWRGRWLEVQAYAKDK